MARTKKADTPKVAVDEEGFPLIGSNTPTTEETPVAKTSAPAETMSKADAVRAAVKAGYNKPKEGVDYIKSEFGMDISTGTFSVTKSQDAKKSGKGGKKKAAKVTRTPRAVAATAAPSANGTASSLLRAVKDLADKYGADEIREILSILGK
jgi:hypothetical protein